MHRILVPVDGSSCSLRALDYAIQQVHRYVPAILYVLTVHSPPRAYGRLAIYPGPERLQAFAHEHDEYILSLARQKLTAAGVAHVCQAVEGDVAKLIVRQAQVYGCESIIMGSRKRGRIASLILGSVVMKVVYRTELPVTVVK